MQTILVIDDDESLRDTIGVMLEQEGFRAVLTGDGRDGFEKTMTVKPDLALVDLRLPGMSGIDICKQLRSANVSTPIIILSAAGDEFGRGRLAHVVRSNCGKPAAEVCASIFDALDRFSTSAFDDQTVFVLQV